ncbi:hypothetical protein PENTCL1PPCAC_18912, partial [Pristionchus entomophagus]
HLSSPHFPPLECIHSEQRVTSRAQILSDDGLVSYRGVRMNWESTEHRTGAEAYLRICSCSSTPL